MPIGFIVADPCVTHGLRRLTSFAPLDMLRRARLRMASFMMLSPVGGVVDHEEYTVASDR